MNRRLFFFVLPLFFLASCNGSDSFTRQLWQGECSGFPSREEVVEAIEEHSDFFDQLTLDDLIYGVVQVDCSQEKDQEAYIAILLREGIDKSLVLNRMDRIGARDRDLGESNFFGIPFAFSVE